MTSISQYRSVTRRDGPSSVRAWAYRTVGAAFVTIQALAGPTSANASDDIFRGCKACHDIGAGAKNKVGPHLNGVMGRKAGSLDGFKYSKAMRKAGEKGLVWTAENLHEYLQKPRTFIPGNRMSFRGMANAEKRAALITYLNDASTTEASESAAIETGTIKPAREFADIVLAMSGDKEFGEYLAGECITCHQATGHADGIPSIVGVPRDYFIRALFEYKTNVRSNEVMKLRVVNLNNEEIAALAAYFSSLEPN